MNKRISLSLTHPSHRMMLVAIFLLLAAGCSHSAAPGVDKSAAEQAAARNQRLATLRKQVQSVQANPNFPPQMKQATITELNREISQLSSK